MNWGKWLGRILLMSLIAAVILSLLGIGYGAIVGVSVTWGAIFGLVAAVMLFGFAIKYNPGKESFMEYFPVLLIVMAVIGTIAIIWEGSPFTFAIEWSMVGLALGFSAVFLSGGITAKILK